MSPPHVLFTFHFSSGHIPKPRMKRNLRFSPYNRLRASSPLFSVARYASSRRMALARLYKEILSGVLGYALITRIGIYGKLFKNSHDAFCIALWDFLEIFPGRAVNDEIPNHDVLLRVLRNFLEQNSSVLALRLFFQRKLP